MSNLLSEDQVKRLEQLDELFERLVEKAIKLEGVVSSHPSDGLVKVMVNGNPIISAAPKDFEVKPGVRVIMIDGAIVSVLPEGLIEKQEEVTFDRVEWDEIGGMGSQIDIIRRKVELPTTHAKLFREFGLRNSKGILLYGPPGCGKTLIAKAIASHVLKETTNADAFVYVKGGELLDKFVGETERKIKNLFENARKYYRKHKSQAVIFIDEAEALMPYRGSRRSSDVDLTIVPTFLSEMDGFEGHNPFIILATNFEGMIDPAILRPGRIDVKISVDRPTQEDCVEIFEIHLKKTKLNGELKTLAQNAAKHLFTREKLIPEVSGAMVENIVNSATEIAILRKINQPDTKTGVVEEDLIKAINNI